MSATSEFEDWTKEIEQKLQEINTLVEKLEFLAKVLKERYRAEVRFVEIFGKRWSHLAGWGSENPLLRSEQLFLSEKLGMVIETNHPLPALEKEKAKLATWIKEKIVQPLLGTSQSFKEN